jgi:hypothetical protein
MRRMCVVVARKRSKQLRTNGQGPNDDHVDDDDDDDDVAEGRKPYDE